MATPIAEQEGRAAGAKVAVTRNPDGSLNVATPANSFILGDAGTAYADAAAAGALAKVKTQVDTDMAALAVQYKGDPQGFQTAAQGYLQHLQGATDPVSVHGAEYGASIAAQHYAGILDRVSSLDVATSKSAIEGRQDYLENAMNGLAADGGTDTPQFQQMARERASLIATRTGNPLFGYSKDMAAVDEGNFQSSLTAAAAVGAARRLYNATGDLGAAVTQLNNQIDKLPLSESQKLKLTGEVTEHMRGLDAVRQQQNEDLRASSETAITLALATHQYDPSQFSDLSAQLRGRRMYAQAAKVDTTSLFLQYWPAMSGANVQQAEAAHQSFLQAVQARQDQMLGGARGLRNNNPGNLVDNDWTRAQPGYAGADGRFAKFATPQAGAAALDQNLQSYGKMGVTTPLQIANRWAPAGDGANDPNAYAAVIAQKAGVGVNEPLDLADGAVRAKVAAAITQNENGPGASGSAEVAPVISSYVKAAQGIFNDRAKQLWAPMKAAFDKGEMPSAQEFSDLKALAPDVTDPDLLHGVHDALTVAQQMEKFKALPLAQQEDASAAAQILAKQGGLDSIHRTLAGQMQAQVDHMKNLAANDPVSYFALRARPDVQKSLGDPFEYDVTNPAALAQGLKAGQAYKNAARAMDPGVTSNGVLAATKREQLATAMPGMNGQQVTGTLRDLAALRPDELDAEMGVKTTRDAIVGLTRSGDPQKMNAAYSFMDQYQKRSPAMFAATFGGDALKDLRVWQAKIAFEPPDQIAKEMASADDPATIKAKDSLDGKADELLKGVDANAVARKVAGGWSAPAVASSMPATAGAAMRAEYADLYKSMYREIGDPTKADAYAVERLRQKYSVSAVNNGALTSYAPDREDGGRGTYYPKINGSFDWIGQQLDDAVKKAVGPMLPAPRRTDADVLLQRAPSGASPQTEAQQTAWNEYKAPRMLVPDDRTAAEVSSGAKPSYQVIVKTPDGFYRPLTGPTGKPLRFQPDPTAPEAAAGAAAMAQRRSDAATFGEPAPFGSTF